MLSSVPPRGRLPSVVSLTLVGAALLIGCGGRTPGLSPDATSPDLGSRADGSPVDGRVSSPDAGAPSPDAAAIPDAAPSPDSGAVFPQRDHPQSGVISGEVRIDPTACPRLSCGNTAGDDCRGKLYVVLGAGVHTPPVATALVDADLSANKPAAFRFGGLPPGKSYVIAARLFEDGVAPADRLARSGDPLRNYRTVKVPPAGFERRHDIVLEVRKGQPAVYDGKMTLTLKLSRGSKVVCEAQNPLRDCKGTLEVLVMDYSQTRIEAREQRQSVDLSSPATTLSITLAPTFATDHHTWPKTLFVRLYEDGKVPPKPTWDPNNLGHYESPFFVGQPTCGEIQRTWPAVLRRGS